MECISARRDSINRSTKRQLGHYYETLACQYLQAQGLALVTRNSQCALGEIDLIMRDGECWIFIEVRYRHTGYFGLAETTVDWRKQRKILLTAINWLQSHSLNIHEVACRFDIFAITGNKYNWITNAFGLEIINNG
ncbi:MAG: YraN family protein [Candidatus Schmidhempelia sp.]|nr:YraN family protein [Candidatus Schmidhempelia sp.]